MTQKNGELDLQVLIFHSRKSLTFATMDFRETQQPKRPYPVTRQRDDSTVFDFRS